MKTLTTIAFLAFFTVAQILGAITLTDIGVLNDRPRLKQFLLENLTGGEISGEATPAAGEQPSGPYAFDLEPQKTFHGLLDALPGIGFSTAGDDVSVYLIASLMIESEPVFQLEGAANPTYSSENGSYVAEIRGWFNILPANYTIPGVQDTRLYERSRWGSLQSVDLASDEPGSFRFDPAYAGKLAIGIFTETDGGVFGYDFESGEKLTAKDLLAYFVSTSGDVEVYSVGLEDPDPERTIFYFYGDDGVAYGDVPLEEVDISRTGKFTYTLSLKTWRDDGVPPEITGLKVRWFGPNGWVEIPHSAISEGRNIIFSFNVKRAGLYRLEPDVQGLISSGFYRPEPVFDSP